MNKKKNGSFKKKQSAKLTKEETKVINRLRSDASFAEKLKKYVSESEIEKENK